MIGPLVLDQKILDNLERLSHKQQRFTGVTHYFWLRLVALGLAVSMVGDVYLVPFSQAFTMWLGVVGYMIASIWWYDWWESESYKRMAKRLANPLRRRGISITFRYIAYLLLTMFLLVSLEATTRGSWVLGLQLLMNCLVFALLFSLYILPACDPLPPTRGKIREWLSSLLRKLSFA